MIRLIKLFTSLFIFAVSSNTSQAENSLDIEFDPYYSNIGYFISLTNEPIPVIIENDESVIINRMLKTTFSMPRFMLIELSVNPLPVIGASFKSYFNDTYNRANLVKGLNAIQVLTEGFEEPYAVSLFFGNIVRFKKNDEKGKSKNKGFTGLLASVGDKHLLNNDVYDDKWIELEWKFKGDQDYQHQSLSWSFRFGYKAHNHPDITNVVYLAYRRNHFDRRSNSFFGNSDIEYKIELNDVGFSIAQQALFITHKWPTFVSSKSAFSLGIGFILEKDKYRGTLASESDGLRLIIRPNLTF